MFFILEGSENMNPIFGTLGSKRRKDHIHWDDRGTGTPKDRDEVKRREV